MTWNILVGCLKLTRATLGSLLSIFAIMCMQPLMDHLPYAQSTIHGLKACIAMFAIFASLAIFLVLLDLKEEDDSGDEGPPKGREPLPDGRPQDGLLLCSIGKSS